MGDDQLSIPLRVGDGGGPEESVREGEIHETRKVRQGLELALIFDGITSEIQLSKVDESL